MVPVILLACGYSAIINVFTSDHTDIAVENYFKGDFAQRIY